jgi:hypothetical protein
LPTLVIVSIFVFPLLAVSQTKTVVFSTIPDNRWTCGLIDSK